ncbi:IPO4 [Branchiostoma lanceolatum]|uniref:IPO4 protein n=1 Tax=Branchiostoma lanceolatum TaxID=7740 RepID=A0A8K0F0A1_BRALA|nr:IPO4 [Branchiostoma lanceolatum]
MAQSLETILENLLVPDNAVIQQATTQLQEAYKDPAIVPALCGVLGSSQNPQVRQYAAVLLRRKIAKQWKKFDQETQASLKATLLQVLVQEPERTVRHAAAQIVGAVARHELQEGRWPELLQFMQDCIRDNEPNKREMGMFVLSTVCDTSAQGLQPHFSSLFALFNTTLEDVDNRAVPFYTIQAMTSLVEFCGTDEAGTFQKLIPKVLAVIRHLLQHDEDQACEALEIFDELVECEVAIVVPHLKDIMQFCLEVSSNAELGDNIRVKALSFVSWLTRLKKKSILKHKLVEPVLSVVFPIMCTPAAEGEEDPDDAFIDELEASTPTSFASQVIDVMALNLPPEKLITPLMQLVGPALESENPYQRKAGLISLAVIAEGCSDHIQKKCLEPFLQVTCKSISDPNPIIRNAALFTMGQFSEHLQPGITKYHGDIVPLLINHLMQGEHSSKEGITKTYYALEEFVENLGKDILPYLPALMESLLSAQTTSQAVHIKELAISAIGAIANAAGEAMVPYFPQVMEQLKPYITQVLPETHQVLQVQALDTLGMFARTIGEQHFLPMAEECLQLGLKLVEEVDDPDLRRCSYGLFASVSTVLKANMAPYLPNITKHMLASLRSTEGIIIHHSDETNGVLNFVEEDLTEESEEEDDDDVEGYSVENSYLEEKEDTCNSFGEIAENSGSAFLPYLEECFNEIFKLIEYPAATIRKAAVTSVGQMCVALHKHFQQSNTEDSTGALAKLLSMSVPLMCQLVREDTDRTVAMTTLEVLSEMLKEIKTPVVAGEGHLDGIVTAVRDVLQTKTACQDDDDAEDDQQAEYDTMLIEYSGEVIPALAVAIPGQQFAPFFAGFLPLLAARFKTTSTDSERSFAVGTISEAIASMKAAVLPFVPHLYPILLQAVKDENDEVRSNGVYGLGVLAEHSGEALYQHYPAMLQTLSEVSTIAGQQRRVVDNMCGAVARLIMTNISAVPMDSVFPVLVGYLPLQDDFEENTTVYKCVVHLYQAGHPQIQQLLPQLLTAFAQVIGTTQINEEMQSALTAMVKDVHQKFPQDFTNVVSSLPPEQAEKLKLTAAS